MVQADFKDAFSWLLGAGFALLLGSVGCRRDQTEVVERTVQQRLDDFARKKRQECQALRLAEASRMVDSILLAEARMQLSDSLARRRPSKPVQPPPVPPIDSAAVKPIFQ